MRIVRPYEPQEKGYTIVDNVVFDYIMPTLSPNAWKILCFIIRKTKGWHKEWDGLPYVQIMEGTGIKSSATVSKALTELLDGQHIIQVKSGNQFDPAQYALNTALEIEVANGTTLENEVGTTSETKPATTSDSKESKQRGKQKETNKEAKAPPPKAKGLKTKTPPAVSAFREAAHRYPPKSWYEDIDQAVGAEPPALEFWHTVVKEYVGMGWNPTNVKGMLDYYTRKEIPGNGNRSTTKDAGNGVRNSSLSDQQRAALGLL